MPNLSQHRPKQSGMSLVGLMVGLLISMIGILAGVTLYQNLIRLSVESRADAGHDAQLASALLTVQLELQSAGFGIMNAGSSQLRKVDDADGTHLYWRYADGGGYVCRGFQAVNVDGVLTLQLVTSSCGNANDDLTGMTWNVDSTLARFPTDPPAVTISVAPASCFPYGLGEPGDHYQVTINAAGGGVRTYATNNYDYCLPNLDPSLT